MDCPLCDTVLSQLHASTLVHSAPDANPINVGHTIVLTRRHVPTYFDTTPEERHELWATVEAVKALLDATHNPAGYNIGFNCGPAAGQTVDHVHIHVIPRYEGDHPDPRGGIRAVIPHKANYLRSHPLTTGGQADPFLKHLVPLLAKADHASVVAAFVQESGLDVIEDKVKAFLDRAGHFRLLTGDYLAITQAKALQTLLKWQAIYNDRQGELEVRVIESKRIKGISFHPKSWRLEGPHTATAFVGSSNLSASALLQGIEWNLRLDQAQDPLAYEHLKTAFEILWATATPLTQEWVAAYAEKAKTQTLPPGEDEPQSPDKPPAPRRLQQEALQALKDARAEDRQRAMTVLATGLGKTWLAAYDLQQFRQDHPKARTLFLAHREELLLQAYQTFRRMFRDDTFGWCVGSSSDLTGQTVFATVSKLKNLLDKLQPHDFDYIIVDEAHHADAPTYRKILKELEPRFLLGLTATPERADEGDVLSLFDDFVAYEAGIGTGVSEGELVPFRYEGLTDSIDYKHIPWRNRQFDPAELAAAVQTEARMQKLWEAWNKLPGERNLVFCCSIAHAEYTTQWLKSKDLRVACVHASPGSDDRAQALEQLKNGEIDAICSVDLFNEGVDVPAVDRVVMLRPTESSVVFLQQLGRGLRQAPGKHFLQVIDFVGNHKMFLERVRTLLSLTPRPARVRQFLETGEADLPPGCSVTVDTQAIDLLQHFLPKATGTALTEAFRELMLGRETRPSAAEMFRKGYLPQNWFHFLASENALTPQEHEALEATPDWFQELETGQLTKSYKMVVLEVLLDRDALTTGMDVPELARLSHAYILRNPELLADLQDVKAIPDPRQPNPKDWLSYWRKNPLHYWGKFFREEGPNFVLRFQPPNPAFETMTREMVEYRLLKYRRRLDTRLDCKVISNQTDPILRLPADLPRGELPVRMPDGSLWTFRCQKEFCNVARPVGSQRNRLPDLLRSWFGPAAGQRGTTFTVRFSKEGPQWTAEPLNATPQPAKGRVVAYPSLRAAAGARGTPLADHPAPVELVVPGHWNRERDFALRVQGDSMDGGPNPIKDGDWVILSWARTAGLSKIEGQVALVQADNELFLKRVKENWLISDNPAYAPVPAPPKATVVALLEEVRRPGQVTQRVRVHSGLLAAEGEVEELELPGDAEWPVDHQQVP